MATADKNEAPMLRWSICLCAVLFAASCASDGGPGTESPGGGVGGVGGVGGMGAAGMHGNAGNAGGAGGEGGVGGAAGHAGVGVTGGSGGEGGAGGAAGDVGGGMGGMGGSGGIMSGDDDAGTDDAGIDDEGYCTVACTGIPPDENAVEACGMISSMDECAMFETGGFPASCRWVTPDSGPCLTP